MSDKAIPDITEGELPEWLIRAVARSCSKKEARGIADSSARAHIRLVLLTEGAKSFRELANQEARRVTHEVLASLLGKALQDPDLHEGARSLAGYLLPLVGGTDTEPGEEAP